MRIASLKLGGADRDADELLEVEVVGGELAAVDEVDERHRQHARLGAQVAVQRQARGRGGRAGRGERHAEDGVGAEVALAGRAVELAQEAVERRLIGRVAADDRRRDHVVDVGDRPGDAVAAVRGPAVAQLDRLAAAGRAPGGHVGAAQDPARDDVDLHGRVAAAVEDHACVDLGDRRAHAFAFPLVGRAAVCPWRSAPESRGSARAAATARCAGPPRGGADAR